MFLLEYSPSSSRRCKIVSIYSRTGEHFPIVSKPILELNGLGSPEFRPPGIHSGFLEV